MHTIAIGARMANMIFFNGNHICRPTASVSVVFIDNFILVRNKSTISVLKK